MTVNEPFDSRALRVSGILLILGLLAEGLSLRWNHPLVTDLFFYVELVLLVAGITVFIYSFAKHLRGKRNVPREDSASRLR
jgi:hypothetical protein